MHEVGLLLVVQVTVVVPPLVIVLGAIERLTVGVAMAVTVVDFVLLPALLEHSRVKVFVPADVAVTTWLPLALFAPLQSPLAVHEVGLFAALQLTVTPLPTPTVVGVADMETTGALTVTPLVTLTEVCPVPVPPAFVQSR